jgi:hypothetical protein
MLLVTLEIVPFGRWDDKYRIKQIFIANVTNPPNNQKGDYDVWFDQDPTADAFKPKPDIHIKGFKRNKGAQELVRQILNKAYTKDKKKEVKDANTRSTKVRT